jgi:hypothetical protein
MAVRRLGAGTKEGSFSGLCPLNNIVKTFLAAGGDWLQRANSKGMKQYADVPKKDLARQCDILQQ